VRPDFGAEALRRLSSPPDELHLYHLGLAGGRGSTALGALAAAFVDGAAGGAR
jgi:hypothetical protein